MNSPLLRDAGIRDVQCGKNVVIVQPSNVYGCQLDDDVFVGPFVEIQKGVRLGQRTRVQSHSFICEGVTIGEECFIAHGVMFVNDLFRSGRPSRQPTAWQRTTIGNHVSIGSGAVILPVRICDDVVIGAGAVVTKSVDRPGVYVGNPARFLRGL